MTYIRGCFYTMELNELQIQRREKLVRLRELGINPYPAQPYDVNASAADIKENYENDKLNYKDISFAGRIMSIRIMGKAAFAVLQDSTDRMQIYVNRDEVCPGEDKLYTMKFLKNCLISVIL